MPRLLYVPILHTEKEAGAIAKIAPPLHEKQSQLLLKEMWDGIQKKIEDLKPEWKKLRIYQEALPLCGQEKKIVKELAEKESLNHRLLTTFMERGSHLEGTEDANLLLKEYDLLSKLFHLKGGKKDLKEYQKSSEETLIQRDQFIAGRVRETLQEGETGLLFMGIRHKVDQLLKADYEITYIIYRIPFQAVKTVYNL